MVRAVPPPVLEKIVARIPVGRLGRSEDIARGALFLVADAADFITGSTLSINAGQHMYEGLLKPLMKIGNTSPKFCPFTNSTCMCACSIWYAR